MRDDLLEQVVDELRTLPPVDEGALARIVRAVSADVAVAPAVPSRARRPWAVAGGGWMRSRIPLAAAAGLALGAGLAGYAIRGGGDAPTAAVVSQAAGESVAVALALRAADVTAVPTQFVLEAPSAARVSLVGDFNAWDARTTPLARVGPRGIWTVTVPLTPGRHTYAFMVDDTVWTLDPRAPAAQDPDFGTPSSVVLIGTP